MTSRPSRQNHHNPAYLLPEFLESDEARPIRILAEYFEPLRRFKAQDIRNILAAGLVAPNPAPPGRRLNLELPDVPVRPLSAYALEPVP